MIKCLPILFLFLFVLFSCKSKRITQAESDGSIWSDKYCKLERLDWQDQSDSITSGTNNNTKGKIAVNVNGDSSATVGGNLIIGGNYKTFVNKTTKRSVKVSPAFYEEFNKKRGLLCNLVAGVGTKTISTPEGKREAEKLYLDLIRLFAGIESNSVPVDKN